MNGPAKYGEESGRLGFPFDRKAQLPEDVVDAIDLNMKEAPVRRAQISALEREVKLGKKETQQWGASMSPELGQVQGKLNFPFLGRVLYRFDTAGASAAETIHNSPPIAGDVGGPKVFSTKKCSKPGLTPQQLLQNARCTVLLPVSKAAVPYARQPYI